MAKKKKNGLILIFWGWPLYSAELRLILMLRCIIIKIQIFGPIFRISPNCLKNRPGRQIISRPCFITQLIQLKLKQQFTGASILLNMFHPKSRYLGIIPGLSTLPSDSQSNDVILSFCDGITDTH